MAARRKEGGKILGFVTLIREGENAFGYYMGFDKTGATKELPLYVSLVYACVAEAIEMRALRLVLGRTALGPKAQIGAKPQAMYDYLRHRSSVLNLAVPSVLAVLPAPKQAPERHPFKEYDQSLPFAWVLNFPDERAESPGYFQGCREATDR